MKHLTFKQEQERIISAIKQEQERIISAIKKEIKITSEQEKEWLKGFAYFSLKNDADVTEPKVLTLYLTHLTNYLKKHLKKIRENPIPSTRVSLAGYTKMEVIQEEIGADPKGRFTSDWFASNPIGNQKIHEIVNKAHTYEEALALCELEEMDTIIREKVLRYFEPQPQVLLTDYQFFKGVKSGKFKIKEREEGY